MATIFANLPNHLIIDIIKQSTHDTNVDYWRSLGNNPDVVNNKTVVMRNDLNDIIKYIGDDHGGLYKDITEYLFDIQAHKDE